jgi:hypothetical protein
MGSRTIAVWEEGRHSTQFDRHPTRGVARLNQVSPDRCDEVVGTGQVLSATSGQATQAKTQIDEEEVGVHQFWFALPHEQRTRFGGHFSELLLRAVRQQSDLTSTDESEA